MRSETLTFVYNIGKFDVELALRSIQSVLDEFGVPFTGFTLYGDPLLLTEALSRLKSRKRSTFNILGQGFEFDLSCVSTFHIDFQSITCAGGKTIPWERWASRFIGNPDFVMAWLADTEYEFWQSAEDPLQYTSKDRSFTHLPQKSNGLPPPLEQTVIDISRNPGRRVLRSGYCEVVGAIMWFGEAFWQRAKSDKSRIEKTDWLRVSNPLPTVMRVEAATNCFTKDEGAIGETQRKLRSLLFPELAEE